LGQPAIDRTESINRSSSQVELSAASGSALLIIASMRSFALPAGRKCAKVHPRWRVHFRESRF